MIPLKFISDFCSKVIDILKLVINIITMTKLQHYSINNYCSFKMTRKCRFKN